MLIEIDEKEERIHLSCKTSAEESFFFQSLHLVFWKIQSGERKKNFDTVLQMTLSENNPMEISFCNSQAHYV